MMAQTVLQSLELYHGARQSLPQASYLASIHIWLKVQPHSKDLHATFQTSDAPPSLLDQSQHLGLHLHLNSSSLPANLMKNSELTIMLLCTKTVTAWILTVQILYQKCSPETKNISIQNSADLIINCFSLRNLEWLDMWFQHKVFKYS